MSSMGGLDRALGMMGHSVEDAGPVVPQQAVRQMSASEKKTQPGSSFPSVESAESFATKHEVKRSAASAPPTTTRRSSRR